MKRSVKKIVAGLVMVVALLAVSGGSTSWNSTAAVVDGQTLTMSALDSQAQAVKNILSANPQYANMDAVGFVMQNDIMGMMLGHALGQVGVTITDQQRDAYWTQTFSPGQAEYALWTDPKAKPCISNYIDWQIAQTMSFTQDQVNAINSALTASSNAVTVNPRYGTWDAQNLTLSTRSAGNQPAAGPLAQPTTFTLPDDKQ